ncbi:MAG: WhiB family transcriptional regulator, partial [Bacteroidales bacterium]
FFPSDGVGVDRARKICKDCPVVSTCLEFALTAAAPDSVAEMPYERMSEMLGTSVGALKASYHLAMKKIEKIMLED